MSDFDFKVILLQELLPIKGGKRDPLSSKVNENKSYFPHVVTTCEFSIGYTIIL